MDATASDFSAHDTCCRHGAHVPTHRAVRQYPSPLTCIILSCYNTFVLNGVTLVFIIEDQTGVNPCDSEIKCSALSGQFVTCFIPLLRMAKKGTWGMFFKLKALVLHFEMCQQQLRESHCLLQKEKLLFLPNLSSPLNNFLQSLWGSTCWGWYLNNMPRLSRELVACCSARYFPPEHFRKIVWRFQGLICRWENFDL